MDMKQLTPFATTATLLPCACAGQAPQHPSASRATSLSADGIRAVSPELARFTSEAIEANLWKRPVLPPRDHSVVTLTTQKAGQKRLCFYAHRAIGPGGVTPAPYHVGF